MNRPKPAQIDGGWAVLQIHDEKLYIFVVVVFTEGSIQLTERASYKSRSDGKTEKKLNHYTTMQYIITVKTNK